MAKNKYIMNNPRRMPDGIDIDTMRAEATAYLESENKKHSTRAKNIGRKGCQRCGYCCLLQPCVPAPDEFKAIADYLGITPQELAAGYTVVNESKEGFYLLWARETQDDVLGQCIPFYRTYDRGYCVFFDKKKFGCRIHEVRPRSAKDTQCWKRKVKERKLTWTPEQIKEVLPNFNRNIAELCEKDETTGEIRPLGVYYVYEEEG